MTKINSRQRRSNRFVRQCAGTAVGWGCSHEKGLCWTTPDRGFIAWKKRARRTERLIARGKITVKESRPVPCPPFQDVTLQFFCEVR